ncbi:MAG TPA: hypothetical protein VJR04_08715 [Terriglobales bacterium]|nr:hypothetical protein [Terriglobales bacterium]
MRSMLLLLTIVASFSSLHATTVFPMSVERLTDISSDVVVAHAVKSWSVWNAQHTIIVTYTQFAVDNRLKGNAGASITVKTPGGSAEGYTQHVAGVRPWSAGESSVLFLRPSQSRDALVVSGLIQGDFRIRRNASGTLVADNGLEDGALNAATQDVQEFNPSSKSISPYLGHRMSLNELQQRVRSRVAPE